MKNRTRAIAAGAGVIAIAAGGVGIATAGGGGDSEQPISGDSLAKAKAAALDHTGGGTVTETEMGDEESFYEVEVTLDDGSQVDVQLNRSFEFVGSEADGAGEDEAEGASDE